MAKRLIAIVDETGTTNRPGEAPDSDFGIAALVLPLDKAGPMSAIGVEIARVTRNSDFKFKHVQKNKEARRLFLQGMATLRRETGVYGYYAAGQSLLNERHRALAAVRRLGTDDNATKAALDQMLADPNGEMLISFFEGMAPALGMYAAKVDATLDVYFDRRSDLSDITAMCNDAKCLADFLQIGPRTSDRLMFKGRALSEHQPLVRLAGVIAGDIRCFFRRHGREVWSRLRPTHDIRFDQIKGDPCDPNELGRLMRVATIQEQLGDGDFFEPSPDTCMLRAYSKRFLSGLLSFASPEGILGHLSISNNASWDILQLPD